MITISGTDRGGLAYLVIADADVADLFEGQGLALPESYGERVQCTGAIAAALRSADGQDVLTTPTGPSIPLSAQDPRSVVLWLQLNTRVASIEGDLPAGIAPAPDVVPDAIY